MNSTLASTKYWQMSSDADARVVWLERREEPFDSLEHLVNENRRLTNLFGGEYATWGVVVDMRRAPARNDEAFEAAMHEFRKAVERSFARTAVLIATQAGMLQINRLTREDGAQTFATTDVTAALKFAKGPG